MIDEKNFKMLQSIEGDLIHIEKNLAKIIIDTPKEFLKIPGLIYYFTSILTKNGVNIVDFGTTFTKLILLVHERDLSRTYEIISKSLKQVTATK